MARSDPEYVDLLYRINLQVGEMSTHNRPVGILANVPFYTLADAHLRGARSIGFDRFDFRADFRGTTTLTPAEAKLLAQAGYNGGVEVRHRLYRREYAEIWLFIASLGDQTIKYRILEDPATLQLGGYKAVGS